ncbi:hypothetical protein L3Q82_011605 [Scortum barcoo]|uniref:Uncharacterized protein n=1 Tax=Scortum barcoo TaxID=214431 RepID=A0ACB8W559_9TELE|nr:hypothetical protein L3Q82_011605 [Scortum barcoo]
MSHREEARGRPRTRWRDYVSRLAWERLRVPPEELEEVSGVLSYIPSPLLCSAAPAPPLLPYYPQTQSSSPCSPGDAPRRRTSVGHHSRCSEERSGSGNTH